MISKRGRGQKIGKEQLFEKANLMFGGKKHTNLLLNRVLRLVKAFQLNDRGKMMLKWHEQCLRFSKAVILELKYGKTITEALIFLGQSFFVVFRHDVKQFLFVNWKHLEKVNNVEDFYLKNEKDLRSW